MTTDTAPPTASSLAGAGLLAYLETLPKIQAHYEHLARESRERARQAAESLPAHPSVAEAHLATAACYDTAARETQTAYVEGRRRHEEDYERANNPRGGIDRERKADVEQSVRDGAA
jgi:hypothetical protein